MFTPLTFALPVVVEPESPEAGVATLWLPFPAPAGFPVHVTLAVKRQVLVTAHLFSDKKDLVFPMYICTFFRVIFAPFFFCPAYLLKA